MDVRRALPLPALAALLCAGAVAGPASATPATGGAAYMPPVVKKKAQQAQAQAKSPVTGGSDETPLAPADPATALATLGPGGTAIAPAGAPAEVVALIAAGNAIATLPYRYGGGHGSFEDSAYDCSGSVSYALHGADLLDTTLASTGLMTWGRPGAGQWITVYSNREHVFLVVAGLRFDTSGQKAAGTRWQPMDRSTKGFVVRHPDGL